jgi:hypothetical protein
MNYRGPNVIKLVFSVLLWMSFPYVSAAPVLTAPISAIELRVPCFTDQRHRFYIQLLQSALDAVRQPARLVCVNDLPGRRMWKMVDDGKLDLIWGMQTSDKDRHMVPVNIDLTNGLAGQRILLIRPENQKAFDKITSVKTLRDTTLIAGFGEGWFDAAVWKTNGLSVFEFPNQFSLIFPMVALGNRGVDYLPRGANEIVTEARSHKSLSIEKHLVFYYNRDMRFYLSKRSARYKPVIEAALKNAEATGLKGRMIDQTFGADIRVLGLAQRKRIQLQAPPEEPVSLPAR